MFTNLNLTDMEVCYKVFRREVIQGITLKSDRFGFEPEVTAKVARFTFRRCEGEHPAALPDLRDPRLLPRADLSRREEDRLEGRLPGPLLHRPLRASPTEAEHAVIREPSRNEHRPDPCSLRPQCWGVFLFRTLGR